MSEYRIQSETLEAIGDAIREKTGDSALINVEDMADEIESIETASDSFTPVTGIRIYSGNAFDFGLQLNPLIHKIRCVIGTYSYPGDFSTGIYCSLSGSNAFFAIAGRNSNYNRWQYGAYGSDNYLTAQGSYPVVAKPFGGKRVLNNAMIAIPFIGNGSMGSAYTEVPQTETLIHVGGGLNGVAMYNFYIYDTEQAEFLLCWAPALDSSGTPCFYDSVNKKFVYNTGTGNLGYIWGDAEK